MKPSSATAGWGAAVVSIAVCFAAAGTGSLMTTPALRQWYPSLHKPAWTPPDGVFAPVWTVLYLTMAIAAWMVWRRRPSRDVAPALALFAVQLVLNVAWSGLFFGLHSPGAGLILESRCYGARLQRRSLPSIASPRRRAGFSYPTSPGSVSPRR